MENKFPGGVWPVMLTPYNEKQEIDYNALEQLVDWYIKEGVSGLFAVCQSSEMFYLSLEERIKLSKEVVKAAAGRVPVIASGHVSDSFEDQVTEINEIAKTGVDAVILITNRLAGEDESDEIWLENCKRLLEKIDPDIPLGFYECPYPYKRLISVENIKWCADTGRFFFLKDTCCDTGEIRKKLKAIEGSNLKLYNANSSTLLESLKDGATGYSGVMANFHPSLYAWLCKNYEKISAEDLSDLLTITSLIERQYYPVNAKYYLKTFENLSMTTVCRVKEEDGLTETFKKEISALNRISKNLIVKYVD
ncbi:dihydrodipicolinate synthase family protein [Ruminiclostridium cellobioparum]|uniref:Dihydrodipicolinate synthase/N-acetylneuraminate lyase n=1 Tax=Ruminiclostridium cellobioparum subsp. termitidis CT1112 TaxID=1195236 RepID=S0FMV1_RUMCE|nr:dihydrodipicolinate synthase family protein [Ruminiclostridium cellobioparum]EMS73555.1 Dihydrodipicolinate synthase/N-acetylneuraminate lyase [Ruminiclostridium cellobioparum subsp. termitidis CT1112]